MGTVEIKGEQQLPDKPRWASAAKIIDWSIDMSMSEPNYLINIFYSEEDEAYIADIPDFDMLSAHGATPQEALEQVLIAKASVVESMRDR